MYAHPYTCYCADGQSTKLPIQLTGSSRIKAKGPFFAVRLAL